MEPNKHQTTLILTALLEPQSILSKIPQEQQVSIFFQKMIIEEVSQPPTNLQLIVLSAELQLLSSIG